MSAKSINELLAIPSGARNLHAYQVLGLADGEQDQQRIDERIRVTMGRLKSLKDATDPQLWTQAAKLVNEARSILQDPARKAELDARFGIVTLSDEVVDPLAGILPDANPLAPANDDSNGSHAADPLATMLPKSDPFTKKETTDVEAVGNDSDAWATSTRQEDNRAPDPPGPRQAVPGTVLTDVGDAVVIEARSADSASGVVGFQADDFADDQSSVVVVEPTKPARRKRGLGGVFMFLTFAIGMVALIGILAYFLFMGPGQVAITSTDGQISISTGPGDATDTVPSDRADDRQTRPSDATTAMELRSDDADGPNQDRPVANPPSADQLEIDRLDWGDEPDSQQPPLSLGSDDPSPGGEAEMDINVETRSTEATAVMEASKRSETAASPMAEPEAMTSSEGPDAMTSFEGAGEPPMLDADMIAQAEQSLDNVRGLIRGAAWGEMRDAAEQMIQLTMSKEQMPEARSLFQIADLASFYRRAIERSLSRLEVGNEIPVSGNLRVQFAQWDDQRLTFQLNNRRKSLTIDEFPFSLAHELAATDLPDSTRRNVARSVYQAVAPRANQEYRDQAIQWLREQPDGEGEMDPAVIAERLETLFGDDA